MRVFLAHSHPNTFGGGERALLEVARSLRRHHQVRLLIPPPRPGATYPELLTFPRTELRRLAWLTTPLGAEMDVLVANSFGANLLSLRNGRRVAYWVHSLRSLFLAPHARRPDLLLRRLLDRVAVRRCARLVANSAYTAARLPALYGRAADAVVCPGVDLALYQPGRPHQPPDGYAITVGRLAPEKGLDTLLRAWCGLPDVPLLVVGAGDRDGRYEQALRAHAPAQVRFLGALPPQEVARLYQRATLAVFTPRHEEFGLAPLEALACGIPVVATDEGGLRETVVHQQTGYLVRSDAELRAAVRLLAGSPALCAQMGAQARQQAEAFSWERTVRGIERVCQEVAAATHGPAAVARG